MSDVNRIVILLPVLNEIDNIAPLLSGIDEQLKGRDYVVCIVDDGSRDGTAEYLRNEVSRAGERLHLIERRKAGA